MTKLFNHGVKAIEALSPERQDLAGKLLLQFAQKSASAYSLTPEQLEDVEAALEEMERGEFATDEEVAEVWRLFER